MYLLLYGALSQFMWLVPFSYRMHALLMLKICLTFQCIRCSTKHSTFITLSWTQLEEVISRITQNWSNKLIALHKFLLSTNDCQTLVGSGTRDLVENWSDMLLFFFIYIIQTRKFNFTSIFRNNLLTFKVRMLYLGFSCPWVSPPAVTEILFHFSNEKSLLKVLYSKQISCLRPQGPYDYKMLKTLFKQLY